MFKINGGYPFCGVVAFLCGVFGRNGETCYKRNNRFKRCDGNLPGGLYR